MIQPILLALLVAWVVGWPLPWVMCMILEGRVSRSEITAKIAESIESIRI